MAIKFHNPKSVALAGKYSLGAEVAPNARLLYVSGQVGVDSKGKLGAGIEKVKPVLAIARTTPRLSHLHRASE